MKTWMFKKVKNEGRNSLRIQLPSLQVETMQRRPLILERHSKNPHKNKLIMLRQKNHDIFAWIVADMPEINRTFLQKDMKPSREK